MVRRGTRKGGRGAQRNSPMPVFVVPSDSSHDAKKVNNQIQALKEAGSTTRVLFTLEFPIGTLTSGPNENILDWANIRGDTDWGAFAQQYLTYRVVAIKYDVYDINPANTATGIFGTYHIGNPAAQPAYTGKLHVLDSPDSREVPPGSGKESFYWKGIGPREQAWYNTGDTDTFGGLRFSVGTAASSAPKYSVIQTAVIDFRGRN